MRAQKANSISTGTTLIADACVDSSRRGIVGPSREGDTPGIGDLSIPALIDFFEVLDQWDREGKGNAKTV